MTNWELVDYGTAPEIFLDDWDTPVIHNGILTNCAFRIINGQRVIVLRIVMPVAALAGTQERVAKAMQEADIPVPGIVIAERTKMLS